MSTQDSTANTNPAASLAGGSGFEMFRVQSEIAAADDESEVAAQTKQRAKELRANAQLRKDEWVQLDDRLVDIAQENLVLVERLRDAGLTVDADLSTLIHEWEGTNEFGDADVDMSAETSASEDAGTFSLHGVPLPIVHKSFHLSYRTLLASRERGQSLDASNQAKAARKVMEALEDLIIDGWGSTVEGYQAYGLTTHPDRNTLSSTSDWDDFSNVSSDDVRGDVIDAIETLEDDNYGMGGSGYIYALGRDAYQALRRRDTGTDQERGLLERLREEFSDLEFIRADRMADSEAVMFKPSPDVIEVAEASDIQNVEWESNDGFTTHMKVMASMTPVVKSDDSGQSGIVHQTGLLSA